MTALGYLLSLAVYVEFIANRPKTVRADVQISSLGGVYTAQTSMVQLIAVGNFLRKCRLVSRPCSLNCEDDILEVHNYSVFILLALTAELYSVVKWPISSQHGLGLSVHPAPEVFWRRSADCPIHGRGSCRHFTQTDRKIKRSRCAHFKQIFGKPLSTAICFASA
jgi:hypothetical protein